MIDLNELKDAREHTSRVLKPWKQRSYTNDLIAAGEWTTIWDDAQSEISVPLVENIYLEALEDKAMSAAAVLPGVSVPPTPGTAMDRAERNQEKKRRVHLSYMDRSDLEGMHENWYYDWFHHGATYAMSYFDPFDREGRSLPSNEIFPYYMRLDPRQVYPISHVKGRLTSGLLRKVRSFESLRMEYGDQHPALTEIRARRSFQGAVKKLDRAVEEIWYFDEDTWGVAFADTETSMHHVDYTRLSLPVEQGGVFMTWAFPPEKHKLEGCPVAEGKRTTFDSEYRGALDSVIPNLRVAHNLMARILDDAADQVYAPVLLTNVENPEDFGPNAILTNDGSGPAGVDYARPPGNYEARSHVDEKKSEARAQARHPEQRQGEAGASIISAKGVNSLMGSFNSELASSQRSMQRMLRTVHARTANIDQEYGHGSKGIVLSDKGNTVVERYDPVQLFKGDYRVDVSYGGNLGLDQQNRILNAATMRNMGGMALRTLMGHSGMIENPLDEEREIGLEAFAQAALQLMMQQAEASGDMSQLQAYAEMIDSDKETHRSAVMKIIKEMSSQQAPTTPGQGSPGGQGDPGAAVLAARSQASGGVPGNAEGQPLQTDALRAALGPGAARAQSEIAPGGTAA